MAPAAPCRSAPSNKILFPFCQNTNLGDGLYLYSDKSNLTLVRLSLKCALENDSFFNYVII